MSRAQKQYDCLAALKHFEDFSIAPTHEKLSAYLGMSSKSGVNVLLNNLEKRGFIERKKNVMAHIEITRKGRKIGGGLSRYSSKQLLAELEGRGHE